MSEVDVAGLVVIGLRTPFFLSPSSAVTHSHCNCADAHASVTGDCACADSENSTTQRTDSPEKKQERGEKRAVISIAGEMTVLTVGLLFFFSF